jgi:hypothetical protein
VTDNHWSCHAVRADGSLAACYGVRSDRHADRERVVLPEADAVAAVGDAAVCVVRFDDERARSIEFRPEVVPKLPPVWFTEVPEPAGKPPATTFLAFVEHDVDPGTLLSRDELRDVPVRSADQLGALRWYPGTGELDQIYVSPRWRKRNIATALILAGGTLTAARRLPSFWSDGQRTSDGNRLLGGHPEWSHRAGTLTHLAPPMTPFDQR